MELIAIACQLIINIEAIYGTIHWDGSSEEGMLSITYSVGRQNAYLQEHDL